MPCSNCNSTQYATWVARMAEIVNDTAENNETIQALQQANQTMSQEYNQLSQMKAACDGQGGPGS